MTAPAERLSHSLWLLLQAAELPACTRRMEHVFSDSVTQSSTSRRNHRLRGCNVLIRDRRRMCANWTTGAECSVPAACYGEVNAHIK